MIGGGSAVRRVDSSGVGGVGVGSTHSLSSRSVEADEIVRDDEKSTAIGLLCRRWGRRRWPLRADRVVLGAAAAATLAALGGRGPRASRLRNLLPRLRRRSRRRLGLRRLPLRQLLLHQLQLQFRLRLRALSLYRQACCPHLLQDPTSIRRYRQYPTTGAHRQSGKSFMILEQLRPTDH